MGSWYWLNRLARESQRCGHEGQHDQLHRALVHGGTGGSGGRHPTAWSTDNLARSRTRRGLILPPCVCRHPRPQAPFSPPLTEAHRWRYDLIRTLELLHDTRRVGVLVYTSPRGEITADFIGSGQAALFLFRRAAAVVAVVVVVCVVDGVSSCAIVFHLPGGESLDERRIREASTEDGAVGSGVFYRGSGGAEAQGP